MKTLPLLLAASLLAAPAFAQSPPPPPAPEAGRPVPPPPPPPGPPRPRGAFIKLEAPNGAEITLRCADGESTRVCADVALDLLDKSRAAARDSRDDRSGRDDRAARDDRGPRWDRGRDDRNRDREY